MKNLFASLIWLLAAATACAQSQLAGTIELPNGQGFTGVLNLSLSQNAGVSSTSPCTGPTLVIPTEIVQVKVSDGTLQSPPTVTSSTCTLPIGIPYNVSAIDTNGNTVFTDQWLITGSTFDVGTAVSSNPNPTINFKGIWQSPTNYNLGDLVTYDLLSYISTISNNTGNIPASSSSWQILSPVSSITLPVSVAYGGTGCSDAACGAAALVNSNPIAPSTVAATSGGTFNNSASYAGIFSGINGGNLGMFDSSGADFYTQDGVTGAVITPSASTNGQTDGVDGMNDCYSSVTACMGIYAQVRQYTTSANARGWGLNLVGIQMPGSGTAATLLNEIDMDNFATGTIIEGLVIDAPVWNDAPAGSAGVVVGTPGGTSGAQWGSAFGTTDGATGVGLSLGANGTGNGSGSQAIQLDSIDSVGHRYISSISADQNGNLFLTAEDSAIDAENLFIATQGAIVDSPSLGSGAALAVNGWMSVVLPATKSVYLVPPDNLVSNYEMYGVTADQTTLTWGVRNDGSATFNGVINTKSGCGAGDPYILWNGSCSGGTLGLISPVQLIMPTGTINANTCTSPTTVTMTGLVAPSGTTPGSQFTASYESDPSSVTGWGGSGGLSLKLWVSATNTLSWDVCNSTGSNITGGALNLDVGAK